MKDQYTAADMASAAAQGFRDGMMHAGNICIEIYNKAEYPKYQVAEECIHAIFNQIKPIKND